MTACAVSHHHEKYHDTFTNNVRKRARLDHQHTTQAATLSQLKHFTQLVPDRQQLLVADPVENTIMEVLNSSTIPQGIFSPSARLQGLVMGVGVALNLVNLLHDNSAHVELTEGGGGLEALLASGCSWMEFLSFMKNKVAFMDENVLVNLGRNSVECIEELYFFISIEARFGTGPNLTRTAVLNVYAQPSSRMQATNICNALLQLLVRSQPSQVHLKSLWYEHPPNISGPAIQMLLEQCPDLELLAFIDATLDENQCRALAAASPSATTLNIRFHDCRVLHAGSTAALADLFRTDNNNNNNQGGQVHYHLDHFQSEDWRILAESLRGNTSVKTIVQPAGRLAERMLEDDEFRALAEALGANQGLLKFYPRGQLINDENWTVLCQSLCSHPTLETLNLSGTFDDLNAGIMSNASKTHRCNCIVDLLRSNTILRSVHLTREERDETIWSESILPHLQTRKYQPLVLEIKAVVDQSRRSKLLGRALDSVKTKPYLLYLFLTGNVDIITASHEARRRT
jgi:hypothetical protein